MSYATITLELYESGIRAYCEDTGNETFIPRGDGNALMTFINDTEDICHPDATFTITEKGKRYLKSLKK
ncbi:MAG: hypothetical protein J6U43_06650 [Bacteroidales bacterium]|nr:hypothetical protein [Bacteroidales bacterium]